MSLQRQAARAGVDVDTYREFLDAASSLTSQYEQYGQSRFGSDPFFQEYLFAANSGTTNPESESQLFLNSLLPEELEALQGKQTEVDLLQDQYNTEFQQLARDFGVNTTANDDGKIYWLSSGNPFAAFGGSSNAYGDEAQFSNTGELGSFIRDRRTDSADFTDFLKEVVPSSAGEILRLGLTLGTGGLAEGFSWLDAVDAARYGYDSLEEAQQNNFAPQEGGDLQGDVDSTLSDVLDGITGVVDTVFGGQDPNAIQIPIPGLPISIPGNMTFEDLLDIAVEVARDTGQAVEGVLDSILGGIEAAGENVPDPGTGDPIDPGPSTPSEEPVVDPGEGTPVEDDDERAAYCSMGMPWGQAGNTWLMRCGDLYNPDGTLKSESPPEVEQPTEPTTPGLEPEPPEVQEPTEPTTPGLDPGEIEDPADPTTPGFGGDPNTDDGSQDSPELGPDEPEDDRPGFSPLDAAGLLLPFLLNPPDRSRRNTLTPGRTLMQPRETEFAERPDYGDPTPMGLFDFGERISQPAQVGYDPEPRRETITATERERLRRLRRQGII